MSDQTPPDPPSIEAVLPSLRRMTGHAAGQAVAITAAATAADALDPSDFLQLIPRADLINPADAVAKLKDSKPYLFKKPVLEMTGHEYTAARQAVIRGAETQRRTDEQASETARLSKKYSK